MDEALRLTSGRRFDARRLAPFLSVAALVVLADQLTKSFIRARLAEGEAWPVLGTLLEISHVENSGAAFGILQGAGTFLLLATIAGVTALSVYLLVAPFTSRWYTFALSLVLGGAIGNFIDRATRGTVTDFIDPTHYPAFNLADSAIFLGITTLLAATYFVRDASAGHEH
jgi:signal peptidase II